MGNHTIAVKRWYLIRSKSRKKEWEYCPKEEFINWFENTPHICDYCGVSEEDWKKNNKKSLEIDRKDNDLAYEISNMTFACRTCNIVKSNIMTYEEMKEIALKYITPKLKNHNE